MRGNGRAKVEEGSKGSSLPDQVLDPSPGPAARDYPMPHSALDSDSKVKQQAPPSIVRAAWQGFSGQTGCSAVLSSAALAAGRSMATNPRVRDACCVWERFGMRAMHGELCLPLPSSQVLSFC